MYKCFLACLSAMLFLGCGSSQHSPFVPPANAPESITQMRDLLIASSYGTGDAIKNSASLKSYELDFPAATNAVKDGSVKIVFGKRVVEVSKNEVLAYESSAESGEGWAVKDDGKIYKITSADIPTAAK